MGHYAIFLGLMLWNKSETSGEHRRRREHGWAFSNVKQTTGTISNASGQKPYLDGPYRV